MLAARLKRLVPKAQAALCQILEQSATALDPPIRSEIFGLQRFAQHGKSLGLTHRNTGSESASESFTPRLRSNIARLRKAYEYIGTQANAGYDISPAAEWLLENFHLLEAQFKEVYEGMPPQYFRTLPVIVESPLAGLPRVYAVAWAFVAHTDGAFNDELLLHFLNAYQESCPLNLNELWALPTTLRVVLMENMRRLAERVATNKAARELANVCSDSIDSYDLDALDEILEIVNARGVGNIFLAQMVRRLQDNKTEARALYQEWLQTALPDYAGMQTQIGADQAADNLSVSNAVTSLRTIGDADWADLVEHSSVLIEALLASEVFRAEQAITRDTTLHEIERLAKRGKRSELSVAQVLLQRMGEDADLHGAGRVPGYWLGGPGRQILLRDLQMRETATQRWRAHIPLSRFQIYLGSAACLTAGLVAILIGHGSTPLLGVLLAFPVSEAVLALVNRMVSEASTPEHLQRIAFGLGIPPAHRVMVVVPSMLLSTRSADNLSHQLLLHYLANPEPCAQFALLTDWMDANERTHTTDEGLLAHAQSAVVALNAKYPPATGQPPRFLLLHRARNYCDTEQRWIGWERKRGKLELLVRALATGFSSDFMDLGAESQIAPGTRYIVTLDSDTLLPPGRLRDLVGIAAHPLNSPVFDASGTKVISGYGILQPRVVTPLPSTRDFSRYHWLFSGQVGVDPYSAPSSEVYQDLFDEGSFCGKGLLNVEAMFKTLNERLPQGMVLSHDLLEGALARCATVTDISLIEDTPFHADVAASRLHRWTRGDWQLLPILLSPGRYPLSAVNRWKMIDNLRRSLVAPVSMLLVLVALWGDALRVTTACALVFAAYAIGPLMGALVGMVPARTNIARTLFYSQALAGLLRAFLGGIWNLAQLAQHAVQSLDAIVRALYRMIFSHRHLLQWTTAAAAQAAVQTRLRALLRQSYFGMGVLATVGLTTLLLSPHPWSGLLLCLVWAGSPVWTWYVSRPIAAMRESLLAPAQRQYIEGVARDTWRYFERCVTPEDNFLPPDNLQVMPFDMLAHRTSPTNIGMYLLSAACARQFGWIGSTELVERLSATLATLQKLQRYEGHFLNWYDTQTLQPLLPMYVSTVDSGNLSAHLLTAAQACLAFAAMPVVCTTPQQAISYARNRLAPLLEMRTTLTPTQRAQLRWMLADHRHTVHSHRRDVAGGDTASALRALAEQLQALAVAPDYRFLYHRKRSLFHIGYRVGEQQLDASFYDLLASESRLTSLVAIAKGDVPVSHWISLGRLFFARGTRAGLRSWSGSMFEYLMPSLVLDEPFGSVLSEANKQAVTEQMAFAQALQLPWGISECAYSARDTTLAYQYAPQGVPRLALRRTPREELVIAPYATALAAPVDPVAAYENLHRLESLGARMRYGFVEALDYSPERQNDKQSFTLVGTFMAHHQGMTIAALANVLQGGVVKQWGMADAGLQAICSLLHERGPREVSRLYAPPPGLPEQSLRKRQPGLLRDIAPGTLAVEPTHLLSNGRYSVSLRANGAGSSQLREYGINRTRDDALRDAYGNFMYVRHDVNTDTLWSLTQHPAPDRNAHYSCTFHADRVGYCARWSHVQIQTTVWVSPEDDIEFRQLEILNLSDAPLEIELVSVMEMAITRARSDESHPAFSNMFVSAAWQAEHLALVFERKPRTDHEQDLLATHFVAQSDAALKSVRVCTDRLLWAGRNQAADKPVMRTGAFSAEPLCNTGLDPVAAIAVQLYLPAQGKSRLTFATAAATQSQALQASLDKHRQSSHIERSSLMSATLAGIRLRNMRITPENFAAIQTLSTAMLLQLSRVHPTRHSTALDRRLLWPLSISGDRPILLITAGVIQGMGLLRSLGQCMRAWAWGQVAVDAVIVNSEPNSYLMQLQGEITAMLEKVNRDCATEINTTRLHLFRAQDLPADTLQTLHALARVHLRADGRPLAFHVRAWADEHEAALKLRRAVSLQRVGTGMAALRAPAAHAGAGHFSGEGARFEFEVNTAQRPPRPWANVLANPQFGAALTESGGGYTWGGNSRLNQLTAWSNDPVADPCGEWFVLQDLRTRRAWCVTPNACADLDATYAVMHTQGQSTIAHVHGNAQVQMSWCVDPDTAVKHIAITITNLGHRSLQLRAVAMVEWIMGASRTDRASTYSAMLHQQDAQNSVTALTCTQRATDGGFGDGTAFLAVRQSLEAPATEDWTCDRRELLDAQGRLCLPAVMGRGQGSNLDPCAALCVPLSVESGASETLVFVMGYAPTQPLARELAVQSALQSASARQTRGNAQWAGLLQATVVSTPDPAFDAMVNHWLLYQAVCCRMWAKAAFYQAGGATGFRDQLQDAMSLAWAAPALLRAQIVLCASRQFAAGDVQHWWHDPTGAGVRTHFSDDLLWLAHAINHYLQATGDTGLLDEQVAFLEGMEIPDGAEDAYFVPTRGTNMADVFEHAARGIDRSLKVGAHGLPLMGSGDWNDGMNRVGIQGRGESVWLAWFLCGIVERFAPLARTRGEAERATRWENAATGWRTALVEQAWDGQWFKRAFFDDGQPLGSHNNAECSIDLMAQIWAVLSDCTPQDLQRQALDAVQSRLVDGDLGLVRLLDPPLQHAIPDAGYIQSYPPGVRENGGQYSHAGVWAVMAQASAHTRGMPVPAGTAARCDLAYQYFIDLSPAHRSAHPVRGPLYGLEPYALAGDVYGHAPYAGRGGWSWYTGAAGMLHRAAIESMFGLTQTASTLCFTPCLPSHWNQATLTLKRDGKSLHFQLIRVPRGAAQATSARWDATVLGCGELLHWPELAEGSRYVIALD